MAKSADDYKFAFNIKQDSIVAHPQTVCVVVVGQALNISMKPVV
jgi:hypothetical protein